MLVMQVQDVCPRGVIDDLILRTIRHIVAGMFAVGNGAVGAGVDLV
jgi:hypothetical protein